MEKIYFVMPAYNEANNIEDTLRGWYSIIEGINKSDEVEAHLVIADDGSKDDTFQKMEALSSTGEFPFFEPLTKSNGGHGQTVLFLYRYAIDKGADYIFQTDSDGQTNPEEFWPLYENRMRYDFQIGYRKGRKDGLGRVFVTKVLRLIVFFLFKVWVTDANAPFRLMQKDKLKAIMNIIPEGYFLCNVAISAIAKKWHYNVKFYPITFKSRQRGVNSINFKRIIKIGIRALKDFREINRKSSNNGSGI